METTVRTSRNLQWRVSLPTVFLVLIAAAIAVGIGIRNSTAGSTPGGYAVSIANDVAPRLQPSDVAAIANQAILSNEQQLGRRIAQPEILSVEALKGSAVPQDLGESSLANRSIVWVVKATGTFVAFSARQGTERLTADSGYFLVDDEDGAIIGMGLPLD